MDKQDYTGALVMTKSHSTRTITVKEAAQLIGVSTLTVYRLIEAGELNAYKKTPSITSAYVVYYDSVRDFIKRVQGRDL